MVAMLAKRYVASMVLTAVLLSAAPGSFDGVWQMDSAKSHVSDGRVVNLTIASTDGGIKMTLQILHQPQRMQAIGVARINTQDLPV